MLKLAPFLFFFSLFTFLFLHFSFYISLFSFPFFLFSFFFSLFTFLFFLFSFYVSLFSFFYSFMMSTFLCHHIVQNGTWILNIESETLDLLNHCSHILWIPVYSLIQLYHLIKFCIRSMVRELGSYGSRPSCFEQRR